MQQLFSCSLYISVGRNVNYEPGWTRLIMQEWSERTMATSNLDWKHIGCEAARVPNYLHSPWDSACNLLSTSPTVSYLLSVTHMQSVYKSLVHAISLNQKPKHSLKYAYQYLVKEGSIKIL